MSKHPKVPAPVPKVFPSIIRTTGTRVFLLAASCAALVVLGGGGYLLAKSRLVPHPSKPKSQNAAPASKVLSSSTEKATATAPTPSQSTPATTAPVASAKPSPTSTSKKTETPGFDLIVNTKLIQKQKLNLYIPFSVKRYGGLSTPIVPGNISVTAGGLLANVTIQSEVMLTPDTGAIVMLPLNLGSNELNVHFSASSGDAITSTSFTYKLTNK